MARITSFFVVVDLQIVRGAFGPHCEGLKIELRRRDRSVVVAELPAEIRQG